MTAQHQNKVSLSVSFRPDDFARLLSTDRAYTEIGVAGRLRNDLVSSLESRIRTKIGNKLVAVRADLGPLGTVTVLDALAYGGVQINLTINIQLDTVRDLVVESFRIKSPVRVGYHAYDGWTSDKPFIRRRKSMATRERHYIKLHGLFIPNDLLPFNNVDVKSCDCPLYLLTPDREPSRHDYIVWICNCCGKKYTCECFRGVMERVSEPGWPQSIPNYLTETRIGSGAASTTEKAVILRGSGTIEKTARDDIERVQYRQGVCHFCRDIASTMIYRAHADTVIKHYLPYILAEAIRSGIDTREAENHVRDRLGVPHIGEGWVSETQLYYVVRTLFPEQRVEREASPPWLGRMRFDIYLPDFGVAIEYQGQQHYRPVERFAGEGGFERTLERDRLKKQRAKEADIKIVEFKYDEILTDEMVRQRIARAIKR